MGPKLALTVMSGIDADELVRAIQDGEVAVLQSVPGIGRRMAERIVVELRDRVAELATAPERPSRQPVSGPDASSEACLEEILSALSNLGVARAQAERAAQSSLSELGAEAPIEALIRTALRGLAR